MSVIEGLYESLFITEFEQSNRRLRKARKIDYYAIGSLYFDENTKSSVNSGCLNTLFKDEEKELIIDLLSEAIENEKNLIDYRNYIFFEASDILTSVIFLLPIELVDDSENISYIIPKVYLYNDGRQIINFSYKFDDSHILDNYQITKKIKRYSFFKVRKESKFIFKIKSTNFVKKVFDFSDDYQDINDVNEHYFQELVDFFENSNLVQTYANTYIYKYVGKYKSKEELEELLYSLSKVPFTLDVNRKEVEKNKMEFKDIILFVNTKRMATALVGETYRLVDEGELPNDINMIGNVQGALDAVLLKKYSEIKVGLNLFRDKDNKQDIHQTNKDRLRYTMADNLIMFSNFETGIELYELIKPKILLKEQMALFDEFRNVTKQFLDGKADEREKNFENFLSVFGLILTIIFSFEPIQMICEELGYESQAFTIYITVNILIILLVIVRNKLKK